MLGCSHAASGPSMKSLALARILSSGRRRKFRTAGMCSLLLAGLLVANEAAPSSMRCANGIVNRGDDAERVRSRCGEPDYIEAWPAAPPLPAGAVWFYNEGGSRLLRQLRLRGGRVIAVDTQGYGFRAPERPDCGPDAARLGWSAYRLIAFCGEPNARQVVGRLLTSRRDHPTGRQLQRGQRAVYRQRWRYDFGPRHLPREYTLDNAIVIDIRTLSRSD